MADLLRIDIDGGKYTLVQHEGGCTELLHHGKPWLVGPDGAIAIVAMGYELEDLRKFKEHGPSEEVEAEIARKLFEVEITLGNCPTPEPSIRKMVEHYYRSHGIKDPETLADVMLGYVANSTRNARVMAEGREA